MCFPPGHLRLIVLVVTIALQVRPDQGLRDKVHLVRLGDSQPHIEIFLVAKRDVEEADPFEALRPDDDGGGVPEKSLPQEAIENAPTQDRAYLDGNWMDLAHHHVVAAVDQTDRRT